MVQKITKSLVATARKTMSLCAAVPPRCGAASVYGSLLSSASGGSADGRRCVPCAACRDGQGGRLGDGRSTTRSHPAPAPLVAPGPPLPPDFVLRVLAGLALLRPRRPAMARAQPALRLPPPAHRRQPAHRRGRPLRRVRKPPSSTRSRARRGSGSPPIRAWSPTPTPPATSRRPRRRSPEAGSPTRSSASPTSAATAPASG